MRDVRNSVNMQQPSVPKRKKKTGIIIGIIIVCIVVGLWIWYSNRGSWICEDGVWVMQGKTNDLQPEKTCQVEGVPKSQERQKPDEKMVELDSEKIAEGIDIRVKVPHVNSTVESPIEIVGEAKGWYNDNSFFVQLIDETGVVLGSGTAKTKEDENLDNYVEFETEIEFEQGDSKSGDLIFYRSDATGENKNIGTFSFPVFFE